MNALSPTNTKSSGNSHSSRGFVFRFVITDIATSQIKVVGVPACSLRGFVLPTPGFAKGFKVCFLGQWYLPRYFVTLATGFHHVFTIRPANILAPDTRRICTGRVIQAAMACVVCALFTNLVPLVSLPSPWSLFNWLCCVSLGQIPGCVVTFRSPRGRSVGHGHGCCGFFEMIGWAMVHSRWFYGVVNRLTGILGCAIKPQNDNRHD